MFAIGTMRFSGQTNTGALRGNITDAQGARINGAKVLLTNSATNVTKITITNTSGDYVFVALDPSTYSLRVEAPGFASLERRNNTVAIGVTLTVDQELKASSTSETIDVSAETPIIDTASAANGQTFTAQQLQDLPNMGRNPFILEKLDNNVISQGDPRFVRAEDLNGTTSVSVAGAPLGANTYVVDGIPISTSNGTVTFIPSLETVADAKVQANTYDAEVGRTGGGVFNTTLKSGSDSYQGSCMGRPDRQHGRRIRGLAITIPGPMALA